MCGKTEQCSTKPPRPQDRAREIKTSAVQTISNAVQCSEFSSAVLNESQAATITANCEIPTAFITPINAGVQTQTCSLKTTCTKGVPHFRATLIFQETQRIFASALCSYHRDILRPRPLSCNQAQQPVSAVKSIQTESPEFFEISSQTNPRVHHTRAVCHESEVFCTHLAPKHRKERAFQFQLPVTSFRTSAVIFDTQVQQACLPYCRSAHNPYDPAQRDKSDIRTRNFRSILRDENDAHVLELPIQDNEEDPNHQWTTTTQRGRKPQESHREQLPSQLNYLCKCCRQPFQVSVSQAHWFLGRSLNIPKRCKKCREKQRQRKECLKTSHPARVIEYAHNAQKTWAIPPQSPSPDSETTSVTSSAHSQPKGRFWKSPTLTSLTDLPHRKTRYHDLIGRALQQIMIRHPCKKSFSPRTALRKHMNIMYNFSKAIW